MSERIEIDGVAIACERGGDGPAVVFAHGLGGRKEVWAAQRTAAAEAGFDATAIDLRGHGESDKPDGPYSVEGWANDLVAALDGLGVDRAALVGHSIGCIVVELAALELGERCTALAMMGGALGFDEDFKATLRGRAELARERRMREIGEAVATTGLTERGRAERPELFEQVVELIAANDPDAYAYSALATAEGEMRDPDRIACPALAFAGAQDPVGPPAAQETIAAAMPTGESAVVPDGAHMCMLEVPDATTEILLGFLRPAVTG
jgi:3-oxoadipate enol-lactonase